MSIAATNLLASLPRPASAVIVGAGGGIGKALVSELSTAGIKVAALARRPGTESPDVTPGHIDITDEDSIVAVRIALQTAPPIRLVIVASGFLHDKATHPERAIGMLDARTLARSFAINAIGPALVAKHLLPLLPCQGKSVFAVLSARVGSISDNRLGGWYGYRASKAALNQIVRTLAIEMRRTRPEAVVVALHPGTVVTGLSAPFLGHVDPNQAFTPQVAAGHLLTVIERLTPNESGAFYAWDGTAVPF